MTSENTIPRKVLDQLIDYLQNWAEAGNMEMNDVRDFMDDGSGLQRLIIKCVKAQQGQLGDEAKPYIFEYEVEYAPEGFQFAAVLNGERIEVPVERTLRGFRLTFDYMARNEYIDCQARFITTFNGLPKKQIRENEVLSRAAPLSLRMAADDSVLVNREVFLNLPHPDTINEGDRFSVGIKTDWLIKLQLTDHFTEEITDEAIRDALEIPEGVYAAGVALRFAVEFAEGIDPKSIQFGPIIMGSQGRLAIHKFVQHNKGALPPEEVVRHLIPELIHRIIARDFKAVEQEGLLLLAPVSRVNETDIIVHFPYPIRMLKELPYIGFFPIGFEHSVASIGIPVNPMPPMYETYYVAHCDMLQKPPRNFRPPPPDGPHFDDGPIMSFEEIAKSKAVKATVLKVEPPASSSSSSDPAEAAE